MDYEGLTADDLTNVAALNRAWLDRGGVRAAPRRLSLERIERLAAAPFLLFSFREHDERLWQRLLGDALQADVLDDTTTRDAVLLSLQAAGLAFLWELARRNPYVARVVSGATVDWCGRLAATPLAEVLGKVADKLIMRARFTADDARLQRLFALGAGGDATLREATQLGVLQTLLTRGPDSRYGVLSAAACDFRLPHREVADKV